MGKWEPSTSAVPKGGEGLIRHGAISFFGVPNVEDLDQLRADVAFLGVPYDGGTSDRPGSRYGPATVREASIRYHSPNSGGWFDVERGISILRGVTMQDVGDVDIRTTDMAENFGRITEAVRLLRAKGALPVLVGGDHSITFPIVRAFAEEITVVQFDAHQDYTDEKFGVRYSYDNQMRRIHELPHVRGLAQIGLRGYIERLEPWEAALRNGVQMVPAYEVVSGGAERALSGLKLAGNCYITVDIDVADPAAVTGTGYPEPGGLSYYQLKEALLYVAGHCRVLGFDLCEVNPLFDSTGVTTRMAARLILDLLGAILPSRE